MLMRKNSTPVYQPLINQPLPSAPVEMNPNKKTLRNIMQFAAAYRVERVPDCQCVEYFLN